MLSSRELPMPIGLDHLSRNDLNPTVLRRCIARKLAQGL
jgi:hypothetical protein